MAAQTSPTHSLDAFLLHNVVQTGRSLGRGAFGCVEVLSMDGLECAGKTMFPMLVDPRNEGAERMKQKYYDECELLSSLRHPNIVQFLGICYLDSASTDNLPVLVMEMLHGNLDNFLENMPNVSLAKKCSILQDVVRGLAYLHGHSPVVIHRDLTAKNVLLNAALVAKIADMGNSLIVECDSFFSASRVPGTMVYMPPEATNAHTAKYNTSLDVFSFGHLALFTITQVFPKDLLPQTYQHHKTGKIMGYTEIERREKYITLLENMLPESHPIVHLIRECLAYNPSARPTASKVLERLQRVGATIDDPYHGMTRMELETRLSTLEHQMNRLEPFTIKGLEMMEQDLLAELKRTRGAAKKKQVELAAEPYVESNGFRYNMVQGDIAGNTINVLVIASVGDQFPSCIEIERRKCNSALAEKAFEVHGHLPPFMKGYLHKEAAADLIATACNDLSSSNADLVRICIDSPFLQRSKGYYLEQIACLFGTSKCPVVLIDYLGHSEKGTGNWCFKDGTISFREIFSLYQQHARGKLLTIQSDCCYSGKWVSDCAETLDSLRIPPCGHKARERGVLLRVFTSCKPDQKAAEPGYSMKAMLVDEGGMVMGSAMSFESQQSTWFSGTKLVCCQGPDSACPKSAFSQLKWMDSVKRGLPVKLAVTKEQGKDQWHYLMLKDASEETAQAFEAELKKNPSPRLGRWGVVLSEGEGRQPPVDIKEQIEEWTTVYQN